MLHLLYITSATGSFCIRHMESHGYATRDSSLPEYQRYYVKARPARNKNIYWHGRRRREERERTFSTVHFIPTTAHVTTYCAGDIQAGKKPLRPKVCQKTAAGPVLVFYFSRLLWRPLFHILMLEINLKQRPTHVEGKTQTSIKSLLSKKDDETDCSIREKWFLFNRIILKCIWCMAV